MVTRNQIICEARKWIGTPFHRQASKRGEGCDCIGLLSGIARNLNLRSVQGDVIESYIPQTYNYFRDRNYFQAEIHKHLVQGNKANGSVVVVGHRDIGWHAGVIAIYKDNCDTWIHSCMSQNKVVEQRFIENMFDSVQYFDWYNNK